jgi:hypothetical protein
MGKGPVRNRTKNDYTDEGQQQITAPPPSPTGQPGLEPQSSGLPLYLRK